MRNIFLLALGISVFCSDVFSPINSQSASDIYRINEINRRANEQTKREWDATMQKIRQNDNRVYERQLRKQREYELELPGIRTR